MRLLKNNQGMALTTIIITIIIMIVIMSALVYSVNKSVKVRKIEQLYNDLELLENEVSVYYSKNGRFPIDEQTYYEIYTGYNEDNEINFVLKDSQTYFDDENDLINPNDYIDGGAIYYKLDISLLDNITLNNTGTFIINTQSLTIYYLEGILVDGVEYHSLPKEYTKITVE